MRTISLAVSERDYEVFRKEATRTDRSIAQLIREAMAVYRAERIEASPPLREVPVLIGHRPLGELPARVELWDEITDQSRANGS